MTPDGGSEAAPDLRRVVVRAGHRGDVATIRAHTSNQDPLVRAAAIGALQRCGDLQQMDLVDAMADPDPGVRVRAAEVAAVHRPVTEPLERALLALLGDREDRVCEVAAFALGEVPMATATLAGRDAEIPPRVQALATTAADHDDSLCRESAVAALGALGHPSGLPAVLDACRDRAQVRRRAVLALAAFEDPRASAMLGELTGDRDLQVSQAATDLLEIETGSDT